MTIPSRPQLPGPNGYDGMRRFALLTHDQDQQVCYLACKVLAEERIIEIRARQLDGVDWRLMVDKARSGDIPRVRVYIGATADAGRGGYTNNPGAAVLAAISKLADALVVAQRQNPWVSYERVGQREQALLDTLYRQLEPYLCYSSSLKAD